MKVKIFIIGILVLIIGVALQFMQSVAGFPEWLSYAGVPLSIAGVYIAIYFGIKWDLPLHHVPQHDVPLQKLEKDALVDYFNDRVPENTVKLFVSDDRMSRARICSNGDVVYIVLEQLELFAEEELKYALNYGWWAPAMPSGFNSIYDCVETAIKENAAFIGYMNEVLLPLPSKSTHTIKFIRPKKFSACLQKVQFGVDGNYYLIKNGQTVEVEANSGMHVIILDGNSYLLEKLDTDCEFLIKAHVRFTSGAYFTLEKVASNCNNNFDVI